MPWKEIGYIYSLVNEINGKRYIGQTTDMNRRMREHLSREDRKGVNQAIAKYGINNFNLEILEKTGMDRIKEREIYWIEKYNAFKGNDYNLKEGGERNDGENNPMYGVTGEDHHSYGKPSPLRGVKRGPSPLRGTKKSKEEIEKMRERMIGRFAKLDNPNAVIDVEKARKILKDRIEKKMTTIELADKYGVTGVTIGTIIKGEHWAVEDGGLQHLVSEAPNNIHEKVSKKDVEMVFKLSENGKTYKEIAQDFPFNFATVGMICRGEHYLCGDSLSRGQ